VLFVGGILVLVFSLIEAGGVSNIQDRLSPMRAAEPLPAPRWQEWAGDDLAGFCEHADAVPSASGPSAPSTGGNGDSSSGSGSSVPSWVQELCDSTTDYGNGTLAFRDPDTGTVSVLDDDSLEGLYRSYCGAAEDDSSAGGGTSSGGANATGPAEQGALWPGWNGIAAPYEGYDRLSLWRPVDDENYPWTAMVFGLPTMAIWYWACDQVIT